MKSLFLSSVFSFLCLSFLGAQNAQWVDVDLMMQDDCFQRFRVSLFTVQNGQLLLSTSGEYLVVRRDKCEIDVQDKMQNKQQDFKIDFYTLYRNDSSIAIMTDLAVQNKMMCINGELLNAQYSKGKVADEFDSNRKILTLTIEQQKDPIWSDIEIYNEQMQPVLNKGYQPFVRGTRKIDCRNLSAGNYFLRMNVNGKVLLKSFVIRS